MLKLKSIVSIALVVAVCGVAGISLAKAKAARCDFNGDYSFFFWDPDYNISGVGYFTVQVDPSTKCRSGVVLPGGILNCSYGFDDEYEDFIEDGFVFLESDGEGTMEIETNSSDGICDTGTNAIELDISLVRGGKSVLFNSDGEEFAGSGLIPQAGYDYTITGRADKCFAGQISGCYDVRFWAGSTATGGVIVDDASKVGDCTICVNGAGLVTGGTCRCNVHVPGELVLETLSEIEGGGYTLGENCQSSTGYLWIETSSDEICGIGSALAFDFAVAQQGNELIGSCDPATFILNNKSLFNAGYGIPCAFEGFLQ